MNRFGANAFLIVAAFLWGSGNTFQQTILQHMGPFMAVGLRCLIAALVLLPFVWRIETRRSRKSDTSIMLVWLIIASYAVALVLFQTGFGHTTVTNAGFIVNTCAVMTPFFVWLLRGQFPALQIWPAALLTLFGFSLMAGGAPTAFGIGDGLCLAAAAAYAVWIVLLGKYMEDGGSALKIMFVQFAAVGLICTAAGLHSEGFVTAQIIAAIPELLYLGVLSTGVGYFLQAVAQRHTSASETSIILSAEAIFGAYFGYLLLGEVMTSVTVAGALLILAGIILSQTPLAYSGLRRASLPLSSRIAPKVEDSLRRRISFD